MSWSLKGKYSVVSAWSRAYLIDTIHNGTISNALQEHWRGLWFTWCREGSLQKHHKFEVQFELVEKQS